MLLPELAWPIPVDLDAVAVGIAEIDGLADEMVGEPDEGDAVARGVRQPCRKLLALGQQQREVIQAAVSGGPPGVTLLHEDQQLATIDAKRRLDGVLIEHRQADDLLVELQRAP